MKTILTLILTALLAACGSENAEQTAAEPNTVVAWANLSSDEQPAALEASERATLELSHEVPGCNWEVNLVDLTITRELVSDGQMQLEFKYETADGAFYSATENAVTRWLQVFEKQGFYRVGLSCTKFR